MRLNMAYSVFTIVNSIAQTVFFAMITYISYTLLNRSVVADRQ